MVIIHLNKYIIRDLLGLSAVRRQRRLLQGVLRIHFCELHIADDTGKHLTLMADQCLKQPVILESRNCDINVH
jgi:hypothetical protein